NQGALPALLPFLKVKFGLTYAAAGVVLLVGNVTSSVIQPVFGYLSDRTARRWLLPWGLVVASVGLALVRLAPSYAVLLALVPAAGAPARARPVRAGGHDMRGAMAILVGVVTVRSWAQLGLVAYVPFYYVDLLKADRAVVGPLLFAFLGAGAVGTLVGGPIA